MNEFRSQFKFNKEQRAGIFFLTLLILVLNAVFYFIDFNVEPVFDSSSEKIVQLQREMDSLRNTAISSVKTNDHKFNPNFINDFKGYTLGMSAEEIDRLTAFRAKGKWINSAVDFQKITGVSDSLLKEMSPHFIFPEWVNRPKKKSEPEINREKSFEEKMDLNKATEIQLQKVNGIGKTLSNRIVKFRNRLGGFSFDEQLNHVYGLQEDVIDRILNEFTIKTPVVVRKININDASASDLATIPGVSFEFGKRIWEFRLKKGTIMSLSELGAIEGISESKLEVIKLYLSVE